jgi:hypothetical protein
MIFTVLPWINEILSNDPDHVSIGSDIGLELEFLFFVLFDARACEDVKCDPNQSTCYCSTYPYWSLALRVTKLANWDIYLHLRLSSPVSIKTNTSDSQCYRQPYFPWLHSPTLSWIDYG